MIGRRPKFSGRPAFAASAPHHGTRGAARMTYNPPLPPLAFDPAAKTVLIVEDNELNMKLVRDLLEVRGYRILQTREGIEALKLARDHHPDLILMDIQLPEVSGLEVTKWMKEDDNLRSIPIVAVTAFAMKGDAERILESGCEDYIPKPIEVMPFLATVDRILTKHAAAN
jgi:two-component system, cell cycle response regulator DivK